MGFALLYPSYGGFPGEACRAQVRSYGCARLEFPHGQHPPPRLNPDFAPLRVIGWPWEGAPDDPAWREAMAAHPQARPARVVEQHRSGYIVADGPGEGFAVESLPEWQRPSGYRTVRPSQDQPPADGARVLLDCNRPEERRVGTSVAVRVNIGGS